MTPEILCGSWVAPHGALESWQLQQTAVRGISVMYLQHSVQREAFAILQD